MLHAKLSAARTWAVLGTAALLIGCASPTDETADWSPQKIYTEAKEELAAGGFDKAISLFDKLEGRAAGTPLAQQAQLDKAYAQFKSNTPGQALATLDRFIRLHPSSPALDYALYLKGLVNFNDEPGLLTTLTHQNMAERDQQAAKQSFESFKELVTRFPNSRYTPDAKLRMTYIVDTLAQNEVHIARYYYERGAYVAATNRAQATITGYPNSPATEEALAILITSYEASNLPQLRDDAKRVLTKNYPNSEFFTTGFKPKANKPWWQFW